MTKKKESQGGAACAQKALKVSAKARYALRFVLDIAAHAEEGKLRTGPEIAKAQNLSEKFLSRIVIPLREKGIVASVRGTAGGFRLAKSAEDITLLEIVEAMQGPIAVLDCLLPGADCDRLRTCIARRVWLDVSQSISRKLAGISIRSILAHGPKVCEELDYCV